jgi:hypothetical protein
LRRNRGLLQGRAERARLPAVEARAAQYGSRLHQQRATRQPRRQKDASTRRCSPRFRPAR